MKSCSNKKVLLGRCGRKGQQEMTKVAVIITGTVQR